MPPPRQDAFVERGYRAYKILKYYGNKAAGSFVKFFLPLLGKDTRMGNNNQYPPLPSLIREGSSRTCFGSSSDAAHRGQSAVQHDANFLKRTYSPINLFSYSPHKKTAFTLAEVLITLGIIGVVAAMTMPSVIGHYKKQETLSRLKKAYTTINQALKLSEADNGESEYWNNGFDIGAEEYLNKYWLPYFNVLKICKTYSECNYNNAYPYKYLNGNNFNLGFASVQRRIPFITTDGVLFSISIGTGTNEALTEDNNIYIDINASREPNTLGKDYFVFKLIKNKGILPAGYDIEKQNIDASCKKTGSGTYCAQLIMMNGWQFPKDYPY